MDNITALLIATVFLYSTGHWIGATVLLVWLLFGVYQQADDPLGAKAYLGALRHYR